MQPPNHGDMMAMLQKPFDQHQQHSQIQAPSTLLNAPPPSQFNPSTSAFNPVQSSASIPSANPQALIPPSRYTPTNQAQFNPNVANMRPPASMPPSLNPPPSQLNQHQGPTPIMNNPNVLGGPPQPSMQFPPNSNANMSSQFVNNNLTNQISGLALNPPNAQNMPPVSNFPPPMQPPTQQQGPNLPQNEPAKQLPPNNQMFNANNFPNQMPKPPVALLNGPPMPQPPQQQQQQQQNQPPQSQQFMPPQPTPSQTFQPGNMGNQPPPQFNQAAPQMQPYQPPNQTQHMMAPPTTNMMPPSGQPPNMYQPPGMMPPTQPGYINQAGSSMVAPPQSTPMQGYQVPGGPQQYHPPGGPLSAPPAGLGQYPPVRPGLNQMNQMPLPQQQQQQQQFQQQQPYPNAQFDQQAQGPKMDLDQIPNPIEVANSNNTKNAGEMFDTNEAGKIPPLITTDFVCRDSGNCNPRFIRSSVYSVPANPDLLKQSKMPLVINLTPFAELHKEEIEPPITDLGELGPIRCKRCKAYMSPFMKFIENGRRFQCPFCDDITPVPNEYFNHLDHMGKRIDMYERPELCLGSFEYVATKDYCRNQVLPQPPAFIFMIDVSIVSVRAGLLHVLCPFIKETILPNLPRDRHTNQSQVKVGFITYDKELHFYNLKSSLAAPQMMIVSDIEEVFVPILDGFLVDVNESKSVIDILLDSLPTMFQETKETELALGPVVEAGIEALKSAKLCGKLFVFHTNLPNCLAPGQLKNREDKKLLGTDKEKQILTPQTEYYGQLGKKAVENGCSIDLFLMPNQYCDLATLSDMCKKTSSQVYKYDHFMADTHGKRLCDDLKYSIESTVAFDAVMKVRTSTGIKPVDYLGNFSMYGYDVELAGLQRQTSMSVELKHEDKLNENSNVYIQMALLFTSLSGQRRIRVHNLSLSVCTQYSQMFSSCELDTLINYVAKLASRSIGTSTPKSIRENLIQQVANILASYRKNCTNTPSRGQFILPETLKLLPVFSNSILKSDALTGAQNITVDDRAFLMHRLMSMDLHSTYALFYPRVIPLNDFEKGVPDKIPTPVRCIYERLKDDSLYLLENGLTMYLWIGANVDPSIIQNLFGVSSMQQLNVEKCKILEIDTPISIYVRSIIRMVNEQRKASLRLIVVRQKDSLEIFFKNLLVEDKGFNNSTTSYVEFLYLLHREIKNIIN